jgi:hypothetical protein
MKREMTTLRFFGVRIALVIATMLSLCVSNNVGPSFLPLPVLTESASEYRQDLQQNTASRAPSSAESDSLRVPMLAQSQKRADKDQLTEAIAATLKQCFVLPNQTLVVAESAYLVPLVTRPSVLQPPGRAPPLPTV